MKNRRFLLGTLLGATLLLGLAILIGLLSGNPGSQFKEGGLVTFISGGLLLWIAWVLNQIRKLRHVAPDRSFFRPATAIWGMMALGFLFLAADEMLALHEKMDKLLHRLFHMEETALTDRLDDLIVGGYGLLGLAALFFHRAELVRWKQAFLWIGAGFTLLFMMVGLDTLTNRNDILESLWEKPKANALAIWLSVLEDSFKVYAETCFLLGWHDVFCRIRIEMDGRSGTAGGA